MATSIPPHNVAELCDAALYLIANPKANTDQLLAFVQGPDFPTGGIIVDAPEQIAEAYRTGRGSFRVRARWAKEDAGRGTWNIVITEIPFMVQKSRLIEKLAELIDEKKLPLVAEVRDESAEDVRVVIEPRSRTVDPAVMMESLYRLSELETRFPLNMNVLVDGVVPRVLALHEALRQWLDHRRNVLVRRSRHRLEEIEHRLEVLAGMLIVYLNLDEVIRIIREEDEPKDALKARFALSDVQANYILDTRLRSLRRLEEMQLQGRERRSQQGEGRPRGARLRREQAVEHDQGADPRAEEEVRRRLAQRQAANHVRNPARDGGPRSDRGDDRARAGDGRRQPQGLDSRAQGPPAGRVVADIQGRRFAAVRVLRGDHVENPAPRHQRARVHA